MPRPLSARHELLQRCINVVPTHVQLAETSLLELPRDKPLLRELYLKILCSRYGCWLCKIRSIEISFSHYTCLPLSPVVALSNSHRNEGLVVKEQASAYVPNYRQHWWKLKADYIPGLGDSVELCIVGASFSSNSMCSCLL